MRRAPVQLSAAERLETVEVAVETMMAWACAGLRPETALVALKVGWSAEREPGWYDVQLALSCAWRRMKTVPDSAPNDLGDGR